ncbi:MAG: exonuclease domain-containing protein [Christensenellales bacterium]|jgi:DNA polymerase-3 subunit epsilon|nr:3'-5' exonuclease [Clostridiales bacterium]
MQGPILVFDTEATDLEPGQICQLAYLYEDESGLRAHNYFFSVDDMSEGAQEVHGFSMEQLEKLSGGLYFEDIAQTFLPDFNQAKVLIGHNVAADERYLRVEMERAGLKLKKVNTFCTMNYASGLMNLARKVVTGRPKPPKLSELAAYYGVTEEEAASKTREWFQAEDISLHDARFDTVLTYLSYKKAIEKGDLRAL